MPYNKDTAETRATFVEQYQVNLGQLHRTCRDLSIDIGTISDWRKQHPDFDKALTDVEMGLNEEVEKSLVELAMNKAKPNVVAMIFFLKNNWNEKYGERPMDKQGEAVLWFESKLPLQTIGTGVPQIEAVSGDGVKEK